MESIEYGTVPQQAVDWLASEGFLRPGDCAMVVGDRDGRFAGPVSRAARIQVCMDISRASLDAVGRVVEGGCRTELFEKDWRTYVPSRGGYDSVLLCTYMLSGDRDALRRIETVSKRSCAFIIPGIDGFRSLCDNLDYVIDGKGSPFPDPEASTDVVLELRERGIEPEIKAFYQRFRPSRELLEERILEECGHSVSEITQPTRGIIEEEMSREYTYQIEVVAWDKQDGKV